MTGARLSQHLAGRDNNLNLVRFLAASAVLVSHAFPITLGQGVAEPLEHLTGATLGWLAVAVFFSLSGLLIANSFDRSSTWERFVIARALRLFPALIVVLLLTVLAGLAFTSLTAAQYVTSGETWSYVPRNLSLAFLQYPLPGVFEANAYPGAINGSLWTLVYEVTCYMVLFFAGIIGILRSKWLVTALVTVLGAAFIYCIHIEPPSGGIMVRVFLLAKLAFPFGLGVLAFVWREKFVFDWRVAAALWAIFLVSLGSTLTQFWIVLALTYSIGWFGFELKGRLLEFNRLGDYSYGIYIYAFPVQQALAHSFPGARPAFNMMAAGPITILLAVLSWHLIEDRSLAQIKPLAQRVRSMRGAQPA